MTIEFGLAQVQQAGERLAGQLRRVLVSRLDSSDGGSALLVHEYLQHTGSFKARGALNLIQAHHRAGTLPAAGVTIASGGNAGLACAWAAAAVGSRATVFLPSTAPAVKLDRLRSCGAEVHLTGQEYADAEQACLEYADRSGALLSHAYDNPLIAAGAGTCAAELLEHAEVDTILVAVGGGGLLAGTIAATELAGTQVVAVEPSTCRALHAALAAGGPVDVRPESVAADSLGARRVSELAFELADQPRVRSVLVDDRNIVAARAALWRDWRIVVEHGGATALAAVLGGSYRPAAGERVAIVLCGANTDPSDLAAAG
ncbi:MAG TPA: serine/threonine dehydratase [Jatrophihabitans sp.]|nr:serine/threonine dehydratase [Jatrophihabitans sp.]